MIDIPWCNAKQIFKKKNNWNATPLICKHVRKKKKKKSIYHAQATCTRGKEKMVSTFTVRVPKIDPPSNWG